MKKESVTPKSFAQGLPLGYTKWNCKYHIVFAPKYRRKVFFEEKRPEHTRNIKKIMSVERNRNQRGGRMPGTHTYAGKHSAQNKRFRLYVVFERKKCVVNLSKKKSALLIYQREKCIVNLSKVEEYEVCVQKPRVLVQGYYVDTVGKNTKAIKEYLSGQ